MSSVKVDGIEVTNEFAMREMSKIAMEHATTYFAEMARNMSDSFAGIDGKDALVAFEKAILSTNAKIWNNTNKQ